MSGKYEKMKSFFDLRADGYDKHMAATLKNGKYHIDIPFSEERQIQVLKDAGFENINVVFRASRSNVVAANS